LRYIQLTSAARDCQPQAARQPRHSFWIAGHTARTTPCYRELTMSRDRFGDMNRATVPWRLSRTRFYRDGSLRGIYVLGMDYEAHEPDLDDGAFSWLLP
jgi:hypothetical protein